MTAPLVTNTHKIAFASPIKACRGEGRLTAKFSVTSRPWSFLCAQSCAHRRGPPDPLRLRPPSPGALQFKGSQTFLPRRSKGRARALQVERRRRERDCSSLSLPLYWRLWGSFHFGGQKGGKHFAAGAMIKVKKRIQPELFKSIKAAEFGPQSESGNAESHNYIYILCVSPCV